MQETEPALRQDVAELPCRAAHHGEALPAELARRERRLQKLAEAKAVLKAGERAPGRRARIRIEVRCPKRSGTLPIPSRRSSEEFIQGYTSQVAIDARDQIIVALHVTAAAPDVQQLPVAIEASTAVLHRNPSTSWPTRGASCSRWLPSSPCFPSSECL